MKNLLLTLLISFFSLFHYAAVAKTIVFVGDSLTEGYGVTKETAYPNLLPALFKERMEKEVTIVNGSVSGSTTASASSRFKWFLRSKPDILVLALGANDGLRGLSLPESQKNLEEVILLAKAEKMKIVLAGMLMPPNYGDDYRQQFESLFKELVKKHDLVFIPFLLEGVAGVKELNQADGIHPNEKGHKILAETVYKILGPLL